MLLPFSWGLSVYSCVSICFGCLPEELPTPLHSAAFSLDTPALAVSLDGGGLIFFDLCAANTAVAAAPEHVGRVRLVCFGPTNSFGDSTLYGACEDGTIRRWVLRGFEDLVEIESIPFKEEVVSLFLSHSGRSVVAVGRVGLVMVASTLYSECLQYTRLQWPARPHDGFSCPVAPSHENPNSSCYGNSCRFDQHWCSRRSCEVAEAQVSHAESAHTSPSAIGTEVSACVLLADVLLHPRAPESADIFYVAITSPTHGLMVLRNEGLLSLDSLASVELRGTYLTRVEEASREDLSTYAGTNVLFLACLSPRSRLLTLVCLIPNAYEYPGCDVHATVVELAPMGDLGGPPEELSGAPWPRHGGLVLTWLGGEGEATDLGAVAEDEEGEIERETEEALLSKQRECCRRYRRLLCVGASTSSVFVYEISFYRSPGDSPTSTTKASVAAEQPGEQRRKLVPNLRFRLRLVYRLDGNRGSGQLLVVPPSIVGGRRVLACSSGPHLLNLFEFTLLPNPDLFALPPESASATETAGENDAGALSRQQQAAFDAEHHAAASTQYIAHLQAAFSNAAAAGAVARSQQAAAEPQNSSVVVHHNAELQMQHLMQPSLREAASGGASENPQQDAALKRQIEQITADLEACTLNNRQLERMQQQQLRQQADSRPPWNSRFSVKGSEYDHLFA
ncbi:hypothetical protein cyc_03357 [Cyclospora cayetanensis]|uniref:Uncharacterized protein n=1 Tax=Cyclospora cayetanensis TaxID=88456 RepID=A0A1D3CUX4_9EIME|nr:hypothetical protein cyc_03357 [Cyclospora cayetanensis]